MIAGNLEYLKLLIDTFGEEVKIKDILNMYE